MASTTQTQPDASASALADQATRPAGESLEESLVRLAGVSPKDIERAERIRARLETPRPLGDVLLEMGAVSQDKLEVVERRRRQRMSLVELLIEDGALEQEGAEAYWEAKAAEPTPTDRQALIESGLVKEEDYLKALGSRLDIPFIEPAIGEIQTDLYQKIPFAYLLKNLVLPLRADDGSLQVVVAYPEDEAVIAEVEQTFGMRTKRYCSTVFRVTETLRTLERLRGKPADRDAFKIQYRELDHAKEGQQESGEEAIQLVDYLLSRAVEMGASDLHIEPNLNRIRVRVRVDGVLHHLTDLPVDFTARVIARIKILARADVTEKRHHQDGKIHVRVGGSEIDIRVSTYVSMFGETVVLRLLDRDRGILPLVDVGFQPRAFSTLEEVVLRSSSGLVLTVGPTGSGKTTTLYSFIDHANDPTEKVISAEDPVEYVIDGVVQCSVNEKTGPTFADSLRAIVRQDPDTIIVGEIRDGTTAHLAVEAALTGHKVFSTFHTEEAVGTFVRLLEMGIEPFLVASTISAVIAQRLVRRLCYDCQIPHRPTPAELRFLNIEREEASGYRFLATKGCSSCAGTGFRGRVAVHEVLVPDDRFRQAVLDRASSSELRVLARTLPEFLTIQEDGILKAMAGITSLQEIIENAPRDTGARSLSDLKKIARTRRS